MAKKPAFKTKAPKHLFAVFAHGGSVVTPSISYRRSEAIEKFMALRPHKKWSVLRHPKGNYQVKKLEVKLCP